MEKQIDISTLKTSEDYSTYFEGKWRGSKPIYKLFRNQSGGYLYDTGTSKILSCEESVFTLLESLETENIHRAIIKQLSQIGHEETLAACHQIVTAIEKEKVLLAHASDFQFAGPHFGDMDTQLSTQLGQIVLEITESCNLHCNYCVFNGTLPETRTHGTRHMSEKTAFAAIDYLVAHSAQKESVALVFYGGEPLLRFPFIQRCVDYAKKVAGSKPVHYSMTTNLLLVTPDIARFLLAENFAITASLDGPQDIQDAHRIDTNGKGTFSRAITGLKTLVDTYGHEARNKIRISMVYAPPYSEAKLNRIAHLWQDYPWLDGILPAITYPQPGSLLPHWFKPEEIIEDKSMMQWMEENYTRAYKEKKEPALLVKEIAMQALIMIFRRAVFSQPLAELNLNGCCIPGVRKLFVSTQGHIALCERVDQNVPYLGHVDTGIDYPLLKKTFIQDYAEKSYNMCIGCWANRFCHLCYLDAYSNKEFDPVKKNAVCDSIRLRTEKHLSFYTMLLEIDPEGLNFINDIQLN